MSSRSRFYNEQRERRLRDDIYEECLTRAYIDAYEAGVEIPWHGHPGRNAWPDTIQPYLERHIAEAIDRGWFDHGVPLTAFQRNCECPSRYREKALIASRAWGQALIRIHAQITV